MPRTVTEEWERRLEQDGLRKLRACLPFRRHLPAFAVYALGAAMVVLAGTLSLDAARSTDSRAEGSALEAGLLRDRGGN